MCDTVAHWRITSPSRPAVAWRGAQPRTSSAGTMERFESQLGAADVQLTGDVLDRIDEIVAPGVTVNPADGGWVSPHLQAGQRRR